MARTTCCSQARGGRTTLERATAAFRGLDLRVKIAMVATGLANFSTRLTAQYDANYAVALGAAPVDIGVLTSLGSLFSALTALPLGWAAEASSVKRVMLLNIALVLLHVLLFAVAGNWILLIPAYLLSTRLLRMGPLADIIFVTASPPARRGTIISLSRVVWSIATLCTPMTAAVLVTHFGGITAEGIRPLYWLQLALLSLVFLIVAWKLPATLGRVDRQRPSGWSLRHVLQAYRDALRGEPALQRWIVLRVVQTFATGLATPFVALWLVTSKGATPYLLGVLGTTSLVVSLLLQLPAGRLADKVGRKRVYLPLHAVTWGGSLLALLTAAPEYLILAGLLGGYATGTQGSGVGGVAQPLFVTWWWESVPEEKRGRFFGIEGLFSLASIPAALVGGLLWQQGLELPVLLLPLILELAIVYPLLTTVPDIVRSTS